MKCIRFWPIGLTLIFFVLDFCANFVLIFLVFKVDVMLWLICFLFNLFLPVFFFLLEKKIQPVFGF